MRRFGSINTLSILGDGKHLEPALFESEGDFIALSAHSLARKGTSSSQPWRGSKKTVVYPDMLLDARVSLALTHSCGSRAVGGVDGGEHAEGQVEPSWWLRSFKRWFGSHDQFVTVPVDSETLEQILEQACSNESSKPLHPGSQHSASQGEERNPSQHHDLCFDLDTLDRLDDFFRHDSQRDMDMKALSSLMQIVAFGSGTGKTSAYDEHLSSTFLGRCGALVRNKACLNLHDLGKRTVAI